MATAAPPTEHDAPQASSKNPLKALSTLDPSKKYTLVFLMSVGATLLVTGRTGGGLLKKAKHATAPPQPAAASASTLTTPLPPPAAPSIVPPKPVSRRPPPFAPALAPLPLFADPHSLRPPTKSLLRTWRTPAPSSSRTGATAYFLPNATLLAGSNSFAEALDREDKLHKDGEPTKDEEEIVDDGFNPAVFAAKAFGIATALTIGAFTLGIAGVMLWYGVDDVSFKFDHSVP